MVSSHENFTNPMHIETATKLFTCQTINHPTLEAAKGQSARMSEVSAGVVTTKRGFAIRVLAAKYDSAVKSFHPNDSERLLGKRWEISGRTLSITRIVGVILGHVARVARIYIPTRHTPHLDLFFVYEPKPHAPI